MSNDFNPPDFDIPFAIINEWEALLKKQGVCSSFYAAAAWGYKQCMLDYDAAVVAMAEVVPPPDGLYSDDDDD